MEEEKLTADEWSKLNAHNLAEENRKIMKEMVDRIIDFEESKTKESKENEKEYWRKVFVSSLVTGMCSVTGEKFVDDIINGATEKANLLVDKLYPPQQ